MSKKAHTRHHYIPQCYLRNFAHSEKGIYSYNKKTKTSYQTAISGVCTLNSFYSVSPENVDSEYDGEDPTLIIEKDILADKIEACYNVTLQNIIARKNECIADETQNIGLCYEDKYIIAKYIAIQFLRLKNVRDEVVEMYENIEPKAIQLFLEGLSIEKNKPELKDLNVEHKYDPAFLHARSTFLDEELLDTFARGMADNYWVFHISENNKFFTSDNPVVIRKHVKDVQPMCMGLTQYGSEVSFPISKDIILIILDREYFKNNIIESYDCRFFIATEEGINRQNYLRFLYAKQFVFNFDNDFHIAELDLSNNEGEHIFLE